MKIIRTSYPLSGFWDTRQGGRAENQDSCGFVDTPYGFMAIVCDGMGGGPAGKQASELAVNTIAEYVNSVSDVRGLDKLLQQAIEQAHQTIVAAGQKYPELKGIGTTVVAVLFHKEKAIIAHVGDSRVYQFRFGRRLFRTTDHSMVAELVSINKLTEEQARLSGQTNLITRALGGGNHLVEIDMRPYEKGDRFLLCTDGIWGALPAKDLVERAAKTPSLAGAVDSLVLYVDEVGRQNGNTHDNLTLALIETKEDSICKEKMSRKVLRIITGLIISLIVSLAIIVVLIVKLSTPNPYEKEAAELKELLTQKDEKIKSLEENVIQQKNKVAEVVNKAAEEKDKMARERQEAAEKAKREAEEAQRKAMEAAAKTVESTKQSQTTATSEIKSMRKKIIEKLEEIKKEKKNGKRQELVKQAKNSLGDIAKKDPTNKPIYWNVDTKLNDPSTITTTSKMDGIINQLKKIK
jgi:serine/threonine protein phosphatase PrpC